MKKVDQTILDPKIGNCVQAVLASIFETPMDETINIIDHIDHPQSWAAPFMDWVKTQGYSYEMFVGASEDIPGDYERLKNESNIGGHFYASVDSKEYETGGHAVVINDDGLVVHDPNPNKHWEGLNIIEEVGFRGYYVFEKLESKEE